VEEMTVGRICVREVVVGSPNQTVTDAACRMAEHDVGSLVVINAERRPIGVLTDRDVALRCVAAGKEPNSTSVSSVMTTPIVSVHESTPIEVALDRMAGIHTRRLAVVDDDERLVGILAMDDVLELLLEEAESIGKILAKGNPLFEG
jgi:CBS domain-containing protein